jgi:pimeloyl-ACP methyl ester carboxylesterase
LKIFKQFRQSPRKNFGCLSKTLKALGPLLFQLLLFGYQFAFHLPSFLVSWLGTGGNAAFLRGAHEAAHGEHKAEYKMMESLAISFGPSEAECKPATGSGMNGAAPEGYGESVLQRAKSQKEAFWNMTRYYTDGAGWKPWTKSLEAIADLYALDSEASESSSPSRRRSSSSASSPLFADVYKGALRAPATILWGEKDQACTKAICLDGIGDYLARDSEVTLLPRSGHWTTIEAESRAALARVVGLYARSKGEERVLSVSKVVNDVYEGASMMVRK